MREVTSLVAYGSRSAVNRMHAALGFAVTASVEPSRETCSDGRMSSLHCENAPRLGIWAVQGHSEYPSPGIFLCQ